MKNSGARKKEEKLYMENKTITITNYEFLEKSAKAVSKLIDFEYEGIDAKELAVINSRIAMISLPIVLAIEDELFKDSEVK